MTRAVYRHRSFVLIAVLVVIGSATLVATSIIFIAQGRVAETAGAADAAQMRALAWSGVQIVMSELGDQRERLLASDSPRLDQQYTVYETDTRAGIVRLLPMSSDGETLFSAEAGKLDLNTVSPGMLGLTGMVEPGAAEAVVAHRNQTLKRPYQSTAELLHVPGASITPRMFYGPLEELNPRDQAQQDQTDLASRVLARLQPDRVRGLADIVTVFAIEPAAQRDGQPRININQPWSDELARKITAKFGDEAAQQVKGMMERGVKFDTEASIIKALKGADLAPRHWPDVIDALTTESGEFHFGRLDINTASLPALISLPEITSSQAAQMVSVREQLSADEKTSIVWPVIEQILTPEMLAAMAGRITTRCFTYRVRIAAGEVNADQPDGPMTNPVILEAVIDVSSERPRVAYLRDISVLQATAQIALEATQNEPLFEDVSKPEIDSDSAAPDDHLAEAEPTSAASPDNSDSPVTDQPPAESNAPAASANRRIGRWLNGG